MLGCLRDPPGEERGRPIGALIGDVSPRPPAEMSLVPFVERIPVQGGESCVGHAIAQAVRIRSVIEDEPIDPAAMAFYALARQVAEPNASRLIDAGSYPAKAIDAALTWGIVDRKRWPDEVDPRRRVTIDVLEAGANGELVGVYRIADRPRRPRIVQALALGHPLFWARDVDRAYQGWRGRSLYLGLEGDPVGGHAGCLVGYDELGVWDAGSWGRGHGLDGFVHIAWDFIETDAVYCVYAFTAAPPRLV